MTNAAQLAQVLGQSDNIQVVIYTAMPGFPTPPGAQAPQPTMLEGAATIGASAAAELGVFWESHTHQRVSRVNQQLGAADDLLNGNFHVTMQDLVDGRDAELIRFDVDWKFGLVAGPMNGWIRAFGSDNPDGSQIADRFVIGEPLFMPGFQRTSIVINPNRSPWRYYGLQLAPATTLNGDAGVVSNVLRRRTA